MFITKHKINTKTKPFFYLSMGDRKGSTLSDRKSTARESWKRNEIIYISTEKQRLNLVPFASWFSQYPQAKRPLVWNPETRWATPRQPIKIGLTRLCGKRVGRAPGRSDRPTEPGDSWLPEKWIEVQPRTPPNQNFYLRYWEKYES